MDNSASFVDDLGADELDTVELVLAYEAEFNCGIRDWSYRFTDLIKRQR